MKIAYFDCFSGISGDMCLGALVDAGVALDALALQLRKLPVKGYYLVSKKVTRSGISATKVDVVLKQGHAEDRKWKDIEKIIKGSTLPASIRQKGHSVFRSLFEAEAKVHGKPVGIIHLHELGAVDCLVDIFGTLLGLELLGIDEVYASPVNLGGGRVKSSHGMLPVPAPATAELLKGVPVYSSGGLFEMTTPTGAALIKYLAKGFGEMPAFIPEQTGMGAGGKDPASMPNVLRIMTGDAIERASQDSAVVVETNIDDMNPQVYEYVSEQLFRAGALDVWLTQIMMKKMRPAVTLSVLCAREIMPLVAAIILSETTSIGVRHYDTSRIRMEREIRHVKTVYGKARVKISCYGRTIKFFPEYEDCREIAEKKGIPLSDVMEEVRKAAAKNMGPKRTLGFS